MNHRDVLIRQLLSGIQGSELGVIPFQDIAHKDFCEDLARDAELSRLKTIQINNGDCSTDDGGKLNHAVFVEFCTWHRRISCTEGHRFRTDLTNSARGSDRLIVQSNIRHLLVGFSPLCVDWIGKRRSCASNISSVGCRDQRKCRGRCNHKSFKRRVHNSSYLKIEIPSKTTIQLLVNETLTTECFSDVTIRNARVLKKLI